MNVLCSVSVSAAAVAAATLWEAQMCNCTDELRSQEKRLTGLKVGNQTGGEAQQIHASQRSKGNP